MNAQDVRDLSDDELSSKLIELKREQFNLRFQGASGQLEKTGRVKQVRRDIARIKTIQTERRKPEAATATKTEEKPAPAAASSEEVTADA